MTIHEIISKNRTGIMGFAMISIMLFHQSFIYNNPIVHVYHLMGYWGVEVFLFLSGMGIVYSLKKNSVATYYKNRMKRLLPPCLFVGVCKYLLAQKGVIEDYPNLFLMLTNLNLWFIYAIVVYYMLAPLLYECIIKYRNTVFIVACFLSFLCLYVPFWESHYYLINHITYITERLPVFILGMMYVAYPINMSVKKTIIIGGIIFVSCVILRLMSIINPFLYLLIQFATPMLCILSSYMHIIAGKMKLSWIPMFFGTCSLELYLWHECVFGFMHQELFSSMNLYIKITLAVGISILLAYLTHIVAKYIQSRDWMWIKRIL